MALTIKELAHLAGVSTATVSLVLSGKYEGRVGEERAQAILELARRHGYRSNLAAKGLAEGRTYRIAVCVEGPLAGHAMIGEYSLHQRLALFAGGIQESGYAIEIVQLDRGLSEDEVSVELAGRAVDGFVFLAGDPEFVLPAMAVLSELGMPAVASGCALHEEGHVWTDVDRAGSFRDAVRRLAREGHGRIALLDVDPGLYTDLKVEAFRSAVREELGVDADPWVFPGEATRLPETLRVTREALRAMPECRAFLLTDNFYGEGVLVALGEAGLSPGADCRVIGFGDTVLAERCVPKLSHYSLSIADQTDFGLKSLLQAIRDPDDFAPRSQLFGPRYVHLGT